MGYIHINLTTENEEKLREKYRRDGDLSKTVNKSLRKLLQITKNYHTKKQPNFFYNFKTQNKDTPSK